MTTIALNRPPEGFTEVRSWALGSLDGLAGLRRSLYRTLTGSTEPPSRGLAEVPERVLLVASELATNALRHGQPPTVVRLLSNGREVVVDVADHAPQQPPVVASRREPGAGGFGLILAQRMSLDVGWFPSGPSTKHVWARFPAPGVRSARRSGREPAAAAH